MNPSVTFMVFIQLPDLGACLSHVGNRAKSVNGRARAMAKPAMPTAGPVMLPDVLTSTSRKPMIGPVQENETSVSVNAMRNMLSSPLVDEALLSTLFVHEEGSVSSNHPKKDRANTTSSRQKKMLNTALVDRALSALAPIIPVMARPRTR